MVRHEADDVTLPRPRATGYYATYAGREYHASVKGPNVMLRSYLGEPTAVGFSPSRIPRVQGIQSIERSQLDRLDFVRTVCRWNGEQLVVLGVDVDMLDVFYVGTRGEWMSQQPGMVRTGKLETHGRLLRADVDELIEFVDPLPL